MPDPVLGLLIVITMTGAVMAVAYRKVFYNLLGFGLAILGTAGITLALMQLLIFLGGIAIAMIFAVMMSTPKEQSEEPRKGTRFTLGIGFAVAILVVVLNGGLPTLQADPEMGTVKDLGWLLLTRFELAFEAVSLLLLGAIIGAVVIARRSREPVDEEAVRG